MVRAGPEGRRVIRSDSSVCGYNNLMLMLPITVTVSTEQAEDIGADFQVLSTFRWGVS